MLFIGFYLILIFALEHIRYLMNYNPDVRTMSSLISYFDDIIEKWCTASAVTGNLIFTMISCRMCNEVYRYRCKSHKKDYIFISGHILLWKFTCEVLGIFKWIIYSINWIYPVLGVPYVVYVHILISWKIFTLITIPPCPCWSTFSRAFSG